MQDLNSIFTIKYFLKFLSPNKKWSELFKPDALFQNYFWLFTIGTLLLILTGKGYVISIFFPLLIYYLAFFAKEKPIKYH